MEESVVIKRVLENKLVPEKIRQAIAEGKCKTSVSSITKERIIGLYGLRKESNAHDSKYEEVNLEIEKIFEYLKTTDEEMFLMATTVCSDLYAIIFTDEEVGKIIGTLDLTALGNTSSYSASLFK